MSADAIPVEILVMIFKSMKGTDAAACRAVCRRWRDVVDSFTDDAWKQFCSRDFGNPKRAKDVSNLSYRDLYKSFALWAKVEKAEEKCLTKPIEKVTQVKVLNNTVVAVLKSKGDRWIVNDVEYYNTQTMTLISRKTYDFDINQYDENEKLIVMKDFQDHIHVIIKPNDKKFVVHDVKCYNDDFTLLDTEVYFKDARNMICVARLKVVDGEETVETEQLQHLEGHVLAVARSADDGVNILTRGIEYPKRGKIYCYRNLEYCSELDRWTPNIIHELWNFGFHWSTLYEWLSHFSEKQLRITKLKPTAIHTHNHVVLLGTRRRTVHVYKRPYRENGELKLYRARPDRIIDMSKYVKFVPYSRIDQLDVVETLNGHRLLVRCSFKLFCVDLTHDELDVTKKRAGRAGPLKRVYGQIHGHVA